MKRIFIISFLISSFFCQGQWAFKTEEDPFDGKELIAAGVGYGGDFPYNNPRIIFRNNIKKNELEVYIDGAGYSGCDNNRVNFSFGNADDVISFYGIESVGNDAVFLDFEDEADSFLDLNYLIDNLKFKNIVYVEVRNDCRINRFRIRLNGSSSALSRAIGDYMKNGVNEIKKLKDEEEKRQKERELQQKLKEERDAEIERIRQEAIVKKLKQDNALKKATYDKLFEQIEGVIIKPSLSAMDEIMEEQFVNYTRPPIVRLKSEHSMLDIDKITLYPTSLSCIYNIVVYDYDLPTPRQAFLSKEKVTLNENSCAEYNKRLNENAQIFEIIKVNDIRAKKGTGEIIITNSSIEFIIPESVSKNITNYKKQYFTSVEEKEDFMIYYFPTSDKIKTNRVIISKGEGEKTVTYELETASPYTNKQDRVVVRKRN